VVSKYTLGVFDTPLEAAHAFNYGRQRLLDEGKCFKRTGKCNDVSELPPARRAAVETAVDAAVRRILHPEQGPPQEAAMVRSFILAGAHVRGLWAMLFRSVEMYLVFLGVGYRA
jgi:hypothetical protein